MATQPSSFPLGERGRRSLLGRSLLRDASGVMVVEAILVYVPVALFFFLTWQVGELAAADLVLARAAAAASREASVVLPDDPRFYAGDAVLDTRGERRRAPIEATARSVLSAAPPFDPSSLELELELRPGTEPDVLVLDMRLRADFRCTGGGLSFIVCGVSGRRSLSRAASSVVQAARYEYSRPSPNGAELPASALGPSL